jgi:hypothetical protein
MMSLVPIVLRSLQHVRRHARWKRRRIRGRLASPAQSPIQERNNVESVRSTTINYGSAPILELAIEVRGVEYEQMAPNVVELLEHFVEDATQSRLVSSKYTNQIAPACRKCQPSKNNGKSLHVDVSLAYNGAPREAVKWRWWKEVISQADKRVCVHAKSALDVVSGTQVREVCVAKCVALNA